MSTRTLQPFSLDEVIEEYATEIAAAYLTETESVVIIDRGDPLDSQPAVATLAHELVHALQDREIGLEDFYDSVRPSLDGTLAARALVEGEATHYDLVVYAALDGAGPSAINWAGYYTNYQLEMLLNGYEDEAPLGLVPISLSCATPSQSVGRTRTPGHNTVAGLPVGVLVPAIRLRSSHVRISLRSPALPYAFAAMSPS